VSVSAFGECGDGGLVAVWCDALFEVAERLGEADGLDVVREREGLLGGVAGGVALAALEVRDREPVGAERAAACAALAGALTDGLLRESLAEAGS
jgi:hypothetical protein